MSRKLPSFEFKCFLQVQRPLPSERGRKGVCPGHQHTLPSCQHLPVEEDLPKAITKAKAKAGKMPKPESFAHRGFPDDRDFAQIDRERHIAKEKEKKPDVVQVKTSTQASEEPIVAKKLVEGILDEMLAKVVSKEPREQLRKTGWARPQGGGLKGGAPGPSSTGVSYFKPLTFPMSHILVSGARREEKPAGRRGKLKPGHNLKLGHLHLHRRREDLVL